MAPENVVELLVRSYDLPVKLEERVLQIAQAEVREQDLISPEEQFYCVEEIVERFQRNWREERAIRFDEAQFEEGSRTNHEVIANTTYEPSELIEMAEDSPHVTVGKVFEILEDHFDDVSLEFLKRALKVGKDIILDIPEDRIQERAPWVLEKLQSLVQKYTRNGKVVLPPRQIKNIRFCDGLEIDFVRRDFGGDPLAFYLEHLEVYEGMGKTELFDFDYGLYAALFDTGKIDSVISDRRLFSSEKITAVVAAKETFNGQHNLVAANLGVHRETVKKYWRADDVRKKMGRCSYSIADVAMILSAHKGSGGSSRKAEKNNSRFSRKTYAKYWAAAGFPIRPVGWQSVSDDVVEQMKTTFEESNGNISEVSRITGSTYKTIVARLSSNDKKVKGTGKSNPGLNDQTKEKMFEVYRECGNYTQTSRIMGIGRNTVMKYCRPLSF
jgi:hypothetical protein